MSAFPIIGIIVLGAALILGICFMERAQRRVLIQYPKRQTARGMQQERSHLPIKLNTAGVIPPIFASSLLLMPLTVLQWAGNQSSQGGASARIVLHTDDGRYDLTLQMLEPIERVITTLNAENAASVEFDPSFFLLTLNNDTSESMDVTVNHVFLDGKSSLESDNMVSLDRRDTVKIQFSDVASSFVEQGNSYWFATVGPAS